MKILMLNYEYPPLGGGGGNVTKALAEELVASGHSVDVVTMGFKGLKKVEVINGVNIYRLSCIRKKKRHVNHMKCYHTAFLQIDFCKKYS
ncbi:TPA: glycosyltransferase family 4 protein [Methanosarcinaceae archaeon]|nr:glycosyltransferase family 4 protein [Methanosarcinaceae archaeon]